MLKREFLAIGILASTLFGVCATATNVFGQANAIAVKLENREWHISSFFDGKTLITTRFAAPVKFANGRLEGSPGCGGFLGGYHSLEQGISILRPGSWQDCVLKTQ